MSREKWRRNHVTACGEGDVLQASLLHAAREVMA